MVQTCGDLQRESTALIQAVFLSHFRNGFLEFTYVCHTYPVRYHHLVSIILDSPFKHIWKPVEISGIVHLAVYVLLPLIIATSQTHHGNLPMTCPRLYLQKKSLNFLHQSARPMPQITFVYPQNLLCDNDGVYEDNITTPSRHGTVMHDNIQNQPSFPPDSLRDQQSSKIVLCALKVNDGKGRRH